MVLMIFVNDLWSLENIPAWMEHVEAGVDGIGLADVVFPAFLFIVGLSLPYAINSRRKKGDNNRQLVKHVLLRSVALLVMGVFLVNGESFNAEATGMAEILWDPLCCLSFILIWNNYPVSMKKSLVWTLRVAGILTLLTLSIIYRGGEEGSLYFAPHWWGILGLIGITGAVVWVWFKEKAKASAEPAVEPMARVSLHVTLRSGREFYLIWFEGCPLLFKDFTDGEIVTYEAVESAEMSAFLSRYR
jgi:hypothetical protein